MHTWVILVVVWYLRQSAMNPGGNINGFLLSYEAGYRHMFFSRHYSVFILPIQSIEPPINKFPNS
jgi:hypothetical protein